MRPQQRLVTLHGGRRSILPYLHPSIDVFKLLRWRI